MAKNKVYLIKSGENSFVEETEGVLGISGGKFGFGTTSPEADVHISGNTQIDGDLSVKGNFSTVNQTTVQIDDKNIELGFVDSPTNLTADGGGITLKGATDKTIIWQNSNSAWNFSDSIHIDSEKSISTKEIKGVNFSGLNLLDESGSGVFIKSGRIGVLNDSPAYDLDVSGSGNFSEGLYVDGNAVVTGEAGKWRDGVSAGDITYTGGKVGISNDSPAYDLDVSGSGNFSAGLYVDGNAVVTGEAGKWRSNSNIGEIIYTGGNVGISNDSPAYDLDVSGSANFSAGLYVDGNAVVTGEGGKWRDGVSAGDITYTGGNVGIGTDNPIRDFYVDGDARIDGDLEVNSQFKVGQYGAIGDSQPIAHGDIMKWDSTNSKWSVGSNIPGGLVTGEVPLGFIQALPSGSSIYSISFVEEYGAIPSISTDLQIEGEGGIIPYVLSGVSESGYNLVFSREIPNNNYRVHTTFGGRPVYWNTGSSASVNYEDGDVNILRDLTVSGNLTVDGTQLIVNTETIKLEDHNIEIASNATYDSISDAGISWGTDPLGGVSPVSLTYTYGQGFSFGGGSVGIGTTNPSSRLTVNPGSVTNAGTWSDSALAITNPTNIGSYSQISFGYTVGTINAAAYLGFVSTNQGSNGYGDLVFGTRSVNTDTAPTERMRINSNGNVGIGTTNPDAPLTISRTHTNGSPGIDNFITLDATEKSGQNLEPGDGVGILFKVPVESQSSSVGARIAAVREGGTENATSTELVFQVSQQDETLDEAMRIDRDGNVGIGTTNPESVLQVQGKQEYANSASDLATSVTKSALRVRGSNNSSDSLWMGVENVNANPYIQGSNGSGSNAKNISINPFGGNVGIGTTNPGATLHVKASDDSTNALAFWVVNKAHNNSIISAYENGDVSLGALTYKDASGNVGIGTTNPSQGKLVTTGYGGHSNTRSFVAIAHNNNVESYFRIARMGAGDSTSISLANNYNRDVPAYQTDDNTAGISDITFRDEGSLSFSTGAVGTTEPVEKMRITSGGNVGIGTTSPGAKLDIAVSSGDAALLVRNATQTLRFDQNSIRTSTSNDLGIFTSGNSGQIYLKQSNGNVGIGTTNPSAKLTLPASESISFDDSSGNSKCEINSGAAGTLQLQGDLDLRFKTTVEAMRINSNGNVGIGTTNPSAGRLDVWQTESTSDSCIKTVRPGTAERTHLAFYNANGIVGTIEAGGTTTSYNTSSDYRLKENVVEVDNAIERVNKLKPCRFNFIADPEKIVDGFLAHEVQEVVPEAISGEKDAVREEECEIAPAELDDDGNVVTEAEMGTKEVPEYQGIDQSKLVPLLTKAIQEQQKLIESQQSKINDLVSRVEYLES
jgi:hypothetical protein